jgi:Fe-S-cluster containining protein
VIEESRRDVPDIGAGDFSSWLVQAQGAIEGRNGSDVPCGSCTACCTSSQFIHIAPDETETISKIPPELLVPAPRLPSGHVVLGFDEQGHCPMLIDNKCSIYEHRPQTCRTYDCRVFAAAGVSTGDAHKVQIDRRIRHWQFSYPGPIDQIERDAVRAAARFLDENRDHLGKLPPRMDNSVIAVLSIEIHQLFLEHDETVGESRLVSPDLEVVRGVVEAKVAELQVAGRNA